MWTVAPSCREASSSTPARFAETGCASEVWATRPSPKKVSGRWRVRSKNWSGITMCPGTYSIFSEPTAETEIRNSTPSVLKP